jgi:hypothetical protein
MAARQIPNTDQLSAARSWHESVRRLTPAKEAACVTQTQPDYCECVGPSVRASPSGGGVCVCVRACGVGGETNFALRKCFPPRVGCLSCRRCRGDLLFRSPPPSPLAPNDSAGLCCEQHDKSVCLSVCPSVCLSVSHSVSQSVLGETREEGLFRARWGTHMLRCGRLSF